MSGVRLPFCNERAAATGERLRARHRELEAAGFSDNMKDRKRFNAEFAVLSRIVQFPFERYPDTTAPWHLLTWPPEHMRWMEVYRIVYLIEAFRQPTGSNTGADIHLEPFQVLILLAVLGPENPDTGLRQVKEGMLTIARKNAKTTLVAGLSTALMILDPKQGGLAGQEIQVGAADREQAGITFTMCDRFIHMDNKIGISGKFRSVPSRKTVQHTRTMTQLKCLSSDAYRAHGGNPCMVLLDEIGNVPGPQAEEFYSVLTTGYGAQREPLTWLLSTQAPNDQHFFSQQVDRAKRINEGALEDDSYAGFVFAVPETDDRGEKIDPFDEQWWYLANPGLGTICSEADMRDWARKARDLPSLQNKFENLRLNRRVSETSAFVSRAAWEANNAGFTPQDLIGRRCWAGLDLAETTDLASYVLVFEPMDDGRMPVVPYFWIPGDGLMERSRRDKVPYDVWSREGLIDTTSAHTIEYDRIAERIVQSLHDFDVQVIGFDRAKMQYLTPRLAALGYEWTKEDKFLLEIPQNFIGQARTVDLLEGVILRKELAHANHPILKWNVANSVVVKDGNNNRKFQKNKSFGRIDGCVAIGMAIHAMDEIEAGKYLGESMLDSPDNELFI